METISKLISQIMKMTEIYNFLFYHRGDIDFNYTWQDVINEEFIQREYIA